MYQPQRFRYHRHWSLRWRFIVLAAISVVSFVALLVNEKASHGDTSPTQPPLLVATPQAMAVYSTAGDARDVDIYPALAYAATSKRFLLVWLSLRNALAQSDGFDLYGQYFDQSGQPSGGQFRISDANTVARSNPPTVVSNGTDFVALWTVKGSPCRLALQTITDSANQPDQLLDFGLTVHQHSPQLLYNPTKAEYGLTFVAGDDYLPPVLLGANLANVADCGNNAASQSEIRVAPLQFTGALPKSGEQVVVSPAQRGAFRPALALNAAQDSYFLVWEDRRAGTALPYRFDLYGQRLSTALAPMGDNLPLATGGDYNNGDNSATWTPRPQVVSGADRFLVTWFAHDIAGSSVLWQVVGRFVTPTVVTDTVELMRMSFGQPHPNDAPSGFLTTAFDPNQQEFLLGVTTHLETFVGYAPSLRVQRLTLDGHLLLLDGNACLTPTVGDRLDPALTAQLSLALNRFDTSAQSGYLLAYSKNPIGAHERNYDIWGSLIALATPSPTVTDVATPTPTQTTQPQPTVTSTQTPTNATPVYQQNLPFVVR